MEIHKSWLKSSAIKKCNTLGRYLPSVCAINHWGKSKVDEYIYWVTCSYYYVNVQGISDCVIKTLYPNLEDYDSGLLSTVSVLIIWMAN